LKKAGRDSRLSTDNVSVVGVFPWLIE